MKYQIFTRFDGVSITETIECESMIIQNGAYLFLDGPWGTFNHRNVITSYPVMFTILKRVDEIKENDDE
jgi:hypothetical protein